MPSPAASASAQPTSHHPPPPRPSTESSRSRTTRPSTGRDSISSLWRYKTKSLWRSVGGRNGSQVFPSGRSAWEWLSARQAKVTSRITGSPRPASAASPRRTRRSGISEGSPEAQSHSMPNLKEPSRRKSLGDLLNAFALKLNIDRPNSPHRAPSPKLDPVDLTDDVSAAPYLPPPSIDMPTGLLERSNSLRQGVEETYKDWSDSNKDFGQQGHKIPLMPTSASEFRRTVEQRRALRENATAPQGHRNIPERRISPPERRGPPPPRTDTRPVRNSRPPRPPFASPGCTGIKPGDPSTASRIPSPPELPQRRRMPYPIPVPPKKSHRNSAYRPEVAEVDDVYRDCVGSLQDLYRQVLTDLGVDSRESSTETVGEVGPMSPRSTPALSASAPKTLPAKLLKAELDNAKIAMFLGGQSQSAEDVSRSPPDYIPQSWIDLAFQPPEKMEESMRNRDTPTTRDEEPPAPPPGTPISPMSRQTSGSKAQLQVGPLVRSETPALEDENGKDGEELGDRVEGAVREMEAPGEVPTAESPMVQFIKEEVATQDSSTNNSGHSTPRPSVAVDTRGLEASTATTDSTHSTDINDINNEPPSPSEYSQMSSGRRYWSDESGQESPITDVCSVQRMSQAKGSKLNKIDEDDSSSECSSSEDRFFELEVKQEESIAVVEESDGTGTTTTTTATATATAITETREVSVMLGQADDEEDKQASVSKEA